MATLAERAAAIIDRTTLGGYGQHDDEGFERFVLDRVGRQRFYRPYIEKVWGESPSLVRSPTGSFLAAVGTAG